MTPHQTLKKYFGYDDFRYGQQELIDAILGRRDALGIMPTGAGKSICFQVPAIMLDGITIVVSPLISLMKDQVHALNQAGITAAFINSSLTEGQISKALQNAANNLYKLIYVAPERLVSYNFLRFAQSSNIPLVVVDEAHCISQWGNDFRPSYLSIADFVSSLQKRPTVAAFTATATPKVKEDIIEKLNLKTPLVLVSGFDRPNLNFSATGQSGKARILLDFLSTRPKDAVGIVYCSTRKQVESLEFELNSKGYRASRYHAGLSDDERRNNQDDFIHDRMNIMVATNAFGMGIDKSNVSFVVHYNMPKDIESYYQEAGRAGRDGQPADCLLLYSKKDFNTQMYFIFENDDESKTQLDPVVEQENRERNLKRLKEMWSFCESTECLRNHILRYFGEVNPPSFCGNCSNCGAEFEEIDVTIEAQKIISCIVRMKERFGAGMVIDVLKGAKNSRLRQLKLNQLSTYGISKLSSEKLSDIISVLIRLGYIFKTDEKYPILRLDKNWRTILDDDTKITMRVKKELVALPQKSHTSKVYNDELFNALKALRLKIANKNNIPAFVVFSDATLIDMCRKTPKNLDEFLNVNGVGQVKAAQYGDAFLQIISDFGHNDIEVSQNV
ncbi:MAG: DNA helicase RecQ [Defluviitaleaceae bacterium]|nr:DNA helicase RecQ [Defluviitaleaceae bacterium]